MQTIENLTLSLIDKLDKLEDINKTIIINSNKRPIQSDFESAWVSDGNILPIPAGITFIWKNNNQIQQTFHTYQDVIVPFEVWSYMFSSSTTLIGFYDANHIIFNQGANIFKINAYDRTSKNIYKWNSTWFNGYTVVGYSKLKQAFIAYDGSDNIFLISEIDGIAQQIIGITRLNSLLKLYQESEIIQHGNTNYFDLATMSTTTLSNLKTKQAIVSQLFNTDLIIRSLSRYKSSKPLNGFIYENTYFPYTTRVYGPNGVVCIDHETKCLLFPNGCSGYVYPLHIDNPPITDLYVVGPSMISQSTFANLSTNSVTITDLPPSTHQVAEYHINLVTTVAATLTFNLPSSITQLSASWQRQTNGNPSTRVVGFSNSGALSIPLNTTPGTRFNILVKIHSTTIEIILVHLNGGIRTSEHLNINIRGNIDGQQVILSVANNFEGIPWAKNVNLFTITSTQTLTNTSCFITGFYHRTETGSVNYMD